MTRDEMDKLKELIANVPFASYSFDWSTNVFELTLNGPGFFSMRSFNIDLTPAPSQTFTQGSGTYILPPTGGYSFAIGGSGAGGAGGSTHQVLRAPGVVTFDELKGTPAFQTSELKCCCGADSVGGLHSNYCDKSTNLSK